MTLVLNPSVYIIEGPSTDPAIFTFTVTATGYSLAANLTWYYKNGPADTWHSIIAGVDYIECGATDGYAPISGPYTGFAFPAIYSSMGWKCEDSGTGEVKEVTIRREAIRPPQIMLQVSRDGGYTWGNEMWSNLGEQGQYLRRAEWRRLGVSRSFVFKFRITDPIKVVLISAAAMLTKASK